ncbi:DMT family transporter [Paradesulfitobacterium ferrireducens]|uniref:DMT family transporter n=1 Tax=Paradesulfitobacterium ferrireducens TaxID=2816476 RepID=UPI001A8F775D|nr:DMT family transporter [Paradesulfitobacterium ferrireducens]
MHLSLSNSKISSFHIKAYAFLALAAFLYAGNVIVGRLISFQIPPGALAVLRSALGLIVLVPLAWNQLVHGPRPDKLDLLRLANMGFWGIAAAYSLFLVGIQYSPANNAAIIIATNPAITNLLLAIGWHVKPTKGRVLGIATSFLGLLLVFSQGSLSHLLALKLSPSDLLLLANITSVALFNIFAQDIMVKFSPLVTTVYSLFFGTIFLIPYGVWDAIHGVWHLSWHMWASAFYMGVVVTGFAIFVNFIGISMVGSGKAAIFSNLNPIFTILLSVAILNEQLMPYHWIGMLLVLAGIYLSVSTKKITLRHKSPSVKS